eukprot:TRINITY_DN57136_c0_g1_i1.p1 TRINITY_DN57136_c0_g1~~TRINITY_DN57136_c0_g1_i1.p1  ORF type:complete len:331 (+),score=25.04 TRINITY_DN57136_c0_g1_i1:53-1045(+)
MIHSVHHCFPHSVVSLRRSYMMHVTVIAFSVVVAGGLTSQNFLGAPRASNSEATSFFLSFDGERIFYRDYSSDNATTLPVVIFISGFGARGGVAPAHIQKFQLAGFRVVSPDLRGQGLSAKPLGLQAWEKDAEARDIAALASHLGLDTYCIAAYSHGSIEALRLSSLDDRLQCLAIGGMGERCTDPNWERPNKWPAMFEQAAHFSLPAVAHDLRVNAWVQRGQACLSREELARIHIPVGLIVGDSDYENGDARVLASMINGCELHRVHGNHESTIVNDSWWSTVVQFLAKHKPIPDQDLRPETYVREVPLKADGTEFKVHRYYQYKATDA